MSCANASSSEPISLLYVVILFFCSPAHNRLTSPPTIFEKGGFCAIMGASGGGKTTLLSALSLRLDTRKMNVTGEFRLNGREYSKPVLKAM
jgi:ABC-type lipoprotein export system ATPase subunit